MELFGIALSVPVSFVLSAVYCKLALKYGRMYEPARRVFYAVSIILLGGFCVEFRYCARWERYARARLSVPPFLSPITCSSFLASQRSRTLSCFIELGHSCRSGGL